MHLNDRNWAILLNLVSVFSNIKKKAHVTSLQASLTAEEFKTQTTHNNMRLNMLTRGEPLLEFKPCLLPFHHHGWFRSCYSFY